MTLRLLLFVAALTISCGGPADQKRPDEPAMLTHPVPTEDLKNCPCGQADWESLPPGTPAENTDKRRP